MKLFSFNFFIFFLVYIPLSMGQRIDVNNLPAPDWPTLTIERHYGDITLCTSLLGITTIACAVVDFPTNTCNIYFTKEPFRWVVQHEEAHCQGYDHYGDNTMHEAWDKYKQELLNMKPPE